MVNLQQVANQGISIFSLLMTQTADYKALQEKRQYNTQSKNIEEAANKVLEPYLKSKTAKDGGKEATIIDVDWNNPEEQRQMDVFLDLVDQQIDLTEKRAKIGDEKAIKTIASPSYTEVLNIRDEIKQGRDQALGRVKNATQNANSSLAAAQLEKRETFKYKENK